MLTITSQKLFSEKVCDLPDTMSRHRSLCFLLSPFYLQDTMPCQWSSSHLPQVLRIWDSVFYLQAFLTLHSFLLIWRPPWDRQFNLKVSRVLCWSSKHSPGPAICLNHNYPLSTKRVTVVGLIKAYGWLITWIICSLNPFHDKLSMSKALCFICLATSHTVYNNFFSLYFLKILASTYDFAVNVVMLINIIISKTHNIHDSIEKLFMQLALMILL